MSHAPHAARNSMQPVIPGLRNVRQAHSSLNGSTGNLQLQLQLSKRGVQQ